MKRFFVCLLAFLLIYSQALANVFIIDSFKFTVPTPTIDFRGCTSSTSDLTTYTFNSVDIGAEGNRTVIVATADEDSATAWTTSSMTIDGNAANEQVESSAASVTSHTSIYSLALATGTSVTITVTYSEAITGAVICVFAAYDLNSSTATDTANAAATQQLTLNIDAQTDGVAVGVCQNGNTSAGPYGWVGVTERADADNGEFDYTTGDAENMVAATPRTVTCQSSTTTFNAGSSAAFR